MSKRAKLWIALCLLIFLVFPLIAISLAPRPLKVLWRYSESDRLLRSARSQDGSCFLLYASGLLVKLDQQGTLLWRQALKFPNDEVWEEMAVGSDENIVVSGSRTSVIRL